MSADNSGDVRTSAATDLQRSAYRALNEDGIVDIVLGLAMLFGALYIGLKSLAGVSVTSWSGLLPVFLMLTARGLRKRYVYPRIGYARARNASPAILLMGTMTLLLVAGLVVVTVYVRRGVQPPAGLMPWLLRVFVLAGAATLLLMGRRTGLVRFYVHACVVLAAVLVSVVVPETHYAPILLFGLPGLFLLATGLVCFFRFLQHNPRPESAHANP